MNRLTSALKAGTSAYFWYDGFNRICTWQSTGGPGVRFNVWGEVFFSSCSGVFNQPTH